MITQTEQIRGIEEKDDAAVAKIIRENLKAYHLDISGTAYFDPELDHLSAYYLSDSDKRAYFVVQDEKGTVLGGAGFAEFPHFDHCAELQKLYLSDAAKGKGLGRRLLEYVQAKASSMGFRLMYLETHSSLQSAIRLYEKLGYQKIEKPPFVFHSAMDAFYTKELK